MCLFWSILRPPCYNKKNAFPEIPLWRHLREVSFHKRGGALLLFGKFWLACFPRLEMSGRSNLAGSLLLLADQRVEHDDEGEQVEVHQEAELQEHGGNSALVGRQLAPPQLRLSVSTRSPSNRHNFRGRSGEQGWTCVLDWLNIRGRGIELMRQKGIGLRLRRRNPANTWTRTCGMCMKSSQLSALLSSGCDVTGMRGTYEALPVPEQEEVEDD